MPLANRKKRLLHALYALFIGIAGALATAPAANAAVPDRWGFALWDGVSAPASGKWPAATSVAPVGIGQYKVVFPGQAASGGVVHVTAITGNAYWCQVNTWFPSGPDEYVYVDCYRPGGVLASTGFTVQFASSSGPWPGFGGQYGYVDSTATGGVISQYNSSGAPNSVGPGTPGVYTVKLPGIATAGPRDGGIQVTAVNAGTGARCKVNDWNSSASGQVVLVNCYNSAGVPTSTRFTLTYQFRVSLYGPAYPPKRFGYLWYRPPVGPPSTNFNSQGGVNTATTGPYSMVQFPLIGLAPDDVQVTAYGPGPEYCGLNTPWVISGTTAIVRDVVCWNGGAVNAGYLISYNSQV